MTIIDLLVVAFVALDFAAYLSRAGDDDSLRYNIPKAVGAAIGIVIRCTIMVYIVFFYHMY